MNEFSVVSAINCGSSLIKFSVLSASDCEILMSGTADGINSENAFLSVDGGGPAPLVHHSYEDVLKVIAFKLEKRSSNGSMALIGHRITHGGSIFIESTITIDEVVNNTCHASPLAPLYNYANLSGIESAQQLLPGVTQVAVFDISFHQTTVPEAYSYDLSWKYRGELDVRRYGFHGMPHRYVSQRAHLLLNLTEDDSGLVAAHFGNGVSICAVRNGQNIGVSMGMTPLEGLMMSTHSGDVGFGMTSWVASQTSQGLGDLERVMNKESGLLGISDLSSDLHVLGKAQHEGHERA